MTLKHLLIAAAALSAVACSKPEETKPADTAAPAATEAAAPAATEAAAPAATEAAAPAATEAAAPAATEAAAPAAEGEKPAEDSAEAGDKPAQ